MEAAASTLRTRAARHGSSSNRNCRPSRRLVGMTARWSRQRIRDREDCRTSSLMPGISPQRRKLDRPRSFRPTCNGPATFDSSGMCARPLRKCRRRRFPWRPVEIWAPHPEAGVLYVTTRPTRWFFLMERYSEDRIINLGQGEDVSIAELAAPLPQSWAIKANSATSPTSDGMPMKRLEGSSSGHGLAPTDVALAGLERPIAVSRLEASRRVIEPLSRIDAVVLAGGSAHGSRACSARPRRCWHRSATRPFSIYCSTAGRRRHSARRALPRSFRRRRAQPS